MAASRSYLPLALQHVDRTPGVAGRVTLQGGPQAGIALELMSWDGLALVQVMTTTTGSDGRYLFPGAPTQADGQYYYVSFNNSQNGSSYDYLAYYRTPLFTGHAAGDHTALGILEIANLAPRNPYTFQKVSLPHTFAWWNRPYSTGDTLTLNLYQADGTLLYQSAPLGNTGSAALASLPEGAAWGRNYLWRIQVYRPDGGTGWGWSSPVAFGEGVLPPGIQGSVTNHGRPLDGLPLWLMVQHEDGQWYADYTTTTQDDGAYRFDIPAQNSGRPFFVMYRNGSIWSTYKPYFLRSWMSYDLYTFQDGSALSAGSFDLSIPGNETPDNAEIRSFPVIFEWDARLSSQSDSYQVQLCNLDCSAIAKSDALGFTGSYTLSSLPPGFYPDIPYIWRVWISDPWGGWGRSFDRQIRFSAAPPQAGIQGYVTHKGGPAVGVTVQLRFWDGVSYPIKQQVKTGSDSSYHFTNVAPYGAEEYHVRFLNDPSGGNTRDINRLWTWRSYSLRYTAGRTYAGGDFDTANVSLLAPPDDTHAPLPVVLTWAPRKATPDDSYSLGFEAYPWTTSWETDQVGYTDHLTLSSLMDGMYYGVKYYWFVLVNGPWGGYGVSYYYRSVTFNQIAASQAVHPAASNPPLASQPADLDFGLPPGRDGLESRP